MGAEAREATAMAAGPRRVLGREAILGASDAGVVKVDAPEWGGAACVRVLGAGTRDILESWQYARREQDDAFSGFRVRISALALCDEDGEPLFEIADAESLEAAVAELGGKAGAVVDRVARRAKDVNGIGEAAEDEAGE